MIQLPKRADDGWEPPKRQGVEDPVVKDTLLPQEQEAADLRDCNDRGDHESEGEANTPVHTGSADNPSLLEPMIRGTPTSDTLKIHNDFLMEVQVGYSKDSLF